MKRTNHWTPIINKDKRQFASWVIDCQELFQKQFSDQVFDCEIKLGYVCFYPDMISWGDSFYVNLNNSMSQKCETFDDECIEESKRTNSCDRSCVADIDCSLDELVKRYNFTNDDYVETISEQSDGGYYNFTNEVETKSECEWDASFCKSDSVYSPGCEWDRFCKSNREYSPQCFSEALSSKCEMISDCEIYSNYETDTEEKLCHGVVSLDNNLDFLDPLC